MSANINSYVGRQAAWHSFGTVTGKYMTWADILAARGLDYDVVKEQLEFRGQPVDSWATFRTDTWDKLGDVGSGYTVVHHSKGFGMVDALVGSVDGAHYETAGSLGKGEIVWGLADLKFHVNVGEDRSDAYLLFSTSYDTSMSHTYRICVTRVVCQNTLNIALREKSRGVFRIRHTKNAESKLADAHKALETVSEDVMSMEQKLNYLATRRVTRESLTDIMDRLFPQRKDADGNEYTSTRRANTLADILAIYELNDNNAFPEQRGTAYNLLNSITNYTDHVRSTHNAENNGRAESAMFGSGNDLKNKALEVILTTADGMPVKSRTIYQSAEIPALQPVENSSTPMLDALLVANNA